MSTNKRREGDFKTLYKQWEHHYRRGDIKRARQSSYEIIDYFEKRGNACKLSSYIDDLEQKGFLPDEIESFRKRILSLQGKHPLEEMERRIKKNCERYLKAYLDENADMKFLQTFSLLLMRFRPDEALLNLILQYARLTKSETIAQAIRDGENLGRSLIEESKEEDTQENLAIHLSKYGNIQSEEKVYKTEEKTLEKKLLKDVDLSDDRAVSDIVIMCLMIQFFHCALTFSKYAQCNILRHYLRATVIFEKGKYTECIEFIDKFFKTMALSRKERSSLVYLQAMSYEKLGNKEESSLRYDFLKDQKLYWEFVS